MVDIKHYPSFHQLSEEESSSEALQSDPDVHVNTYLCTLEDTVAEKWDRRPSPQGLTAASDTVPAAVGFNPKQCRRMTISAVLRIAVLVLTWKTFPGSIMTLQK